MFFCITLFLLSFWDFSDTNVNPYVTGPLFSKTDNLFYHFSVLFSLETFYSLWIQWLSPFLSILPQNLPSRVCFIVIIIFSVWKLYLISLYIIYFLDDTWSLTLVKGVFAMVYSYICTVVKVSVKWFQHLHCLVTRVCYCLFHKGLLLPFPTWVEVGSLHIDPWNFK